MKLKQQLEQYASLSTDAVTICSPLQKLGIIGFFYIRMYPNGEMMDITTRPDWAIFYLEKLFAEQYPCTAFSDHLYREEGINLWKLNQENPIWQDGNEIFGYGNGISFCEEKKNYKEIFSFYARNTNENINQFYLNHLDFLRNFKSYFIDQGKALINQAENNLFLLPLTYQKLFSHIKNKLPSEPNPSREKNSIPLLNLPEHYIALLTSREKECLYYLLRGFNAKQIAKILLISPRTIEFHFNNIKSKFKCRTKAEVIRFLYTFETNLP